MMIDKIKEHIAKIEDFTAKTKEELEQFRIQYLGKKGLLNDFFAAFKEVPNEEKKTFGQVVNELKQKAEAKVQEWRDRLEERNESNGIYGDLSRPAAPARRLRRTACGRAERAGLRRAQRRLQTDDARILGHGQNG